MVGYRWFTINSAKELKLTGWVKNLADGTVEIKAFGDKGLLNDFIKQLKTGPISSKVSDVRIQEIEEDLAYTDFGVER